MLNILILTVALQSTPTPTFLWDYKSADLSTGEVNRFELQIDKGEWTDVGRMAAADQSEAPAGSTTYTVNVPALTLGQHTAQVRACNPVECSEPAVLTFTISIKPVPPSNFRVGGIK